MRFTLDTLGRLVWPPDRQGRAIYPTGFEELAAKLGRPLHPPGRDIRGIVIPGGGLSGSTCLHSATLRTVSSSSLRNRLRAA